ncbi:MAG: LysR family transcriptional regulator AphB [Oceanospirillaceae bacterium]|jgi:LysR family transcriptional regulator AphB
MFDNIVLFVHIVQQQSLGAAANKLNLPAATVTRRLKRLEVQVGRQLIHRSARQFVLTPEGESFYQAYAGLVEQLEQTQLKLSTQMNSLIGPLKVLAPNNISTGLLQPMWSKFIKAYPNIKLELSLNNSMQNMLSSGADIALRIGPQESSLLYQKRLGTLRTVLVASPEYLALNGAPQNLDALQEHRLIGTNTLPSWVMYSAQGAKQQMLHPRFSTITDDIKLVTQLVCDDIGISLLPSSEVFDLLEQGVLVHILKPWQGPNRDLYTVWPSGKLLSARAKCLRDFMHQHFERNNYDLLAGE